MTDEIKASPEYPSKHHGVALIVGGGPLALVELRLANSRLPERPYIIAVNSMVSRVSCQAMVTSHPVAVQKLMFPCVIDDRPIVHVYPSDQREVPQNVAGADYVWSGPPAASGSSSLPAVLIAKAIGFEEIFLCGVPLTKTGYLDGYPSQGIGEFNNTPCGKVMNGTVRQRRETWTRFHKAGKLTGVTSFSGFTRELLGEHQFQKELV